MAGLIDRIERHFFAKTNGGVIDFRLVVETPTPGTV